MSAEAGTLPGVYPGNPSLPKEVREKILSTFRHTLNLYGEGKLDDCLIGCDFILKMDPRFAPAKKLLEKAKNPAAEVDVAELESFVAGTPTRQERVVTLDPDRLLIRAVESHNARDFDAAIAAASQVLEVLPGNQAAREILGKARQKKEAQPQFDAGRQRALAALEGGKPAQARAELEAMRRLDPEHPAIPLLERKIGNETTAAASPKASPAAAGASRSSGGPDLSAFEQQFSMPASEPQIAFDDTAPVGARAPLSDPISAEPAGGLGELDSLSLDSLSLDLPPSVEPVAPPPADPRGARTGPLASFSHASSPPSPGSPADLWTGEPEELSEAAPRAEAVAPIGESLLDESDPASPEPESAPSDLEIPRLLQQGDDAARKGDRQQAIEIWSRIFLIDINNSDAVLRIEKVRQEMAEGNRRVAEGLKTGRERFEAADFSASREAFLNVLAVDENDATARFYLERIEEQLARPAAAAQPPIPSETADIASGGAGAVPTVAASAAKDAVEARAAYARRALFRLPANRKALALGGLALLVVLGAGTYMLLRLRGEATPASGAAAPGAPAMEQAMVLFRDGKVPETVAILRRIPPGHPDYDRAQKLLASLASAPAAAGNPDTAGGGGPEAAAPLAAENDAASRRAAAEQALQEKRYIEALKNFNLAGPAFAGDPAFAQARARAAEKVTQLTPAVKLYNEADYETAIPILWRIYSEDHGNQDARAYLERAYFNQGIGQLQNGLYGRAKESFGEMLALSPRDETAIRHRKFAQSYETRELDLMGRIYVRHVQPRH